MQREWWMWEMWDEEGRLRWSAMDGEIATQSRRF